MLGVAWQRSRLQMENEPPLWSSSEWNWSVDDDTASENEDNPVVSEWCEIPLESAEEGTPTKENVAVGDSNAAETSTDETGKDVPDSFDGSSTEPHNKSLAYQLGMMVVSGAAKMVNNVSDTSKPQKDEEKLLKLQEVLENTKTQYSALCLEYENAKEWIAYYANKQDSLERQLKENSELHDSARASYVQQLKVSESDVEHLRTQLVNTSRENAELHAQLIEVQNLTEDMTKQVKDAEEKVSESVRRQQEAEVALKCATQPSIGEDTTDASVQCDSDKLATNHDSGTDVSECEAPQETNRREADLTAALAAANSRYESMRRRLLISLESMQAQTSQMRTSRIALESALNESRNLKEQLEGERKKVTCVESQREAAEKRSQVTEEKLKEQEVICSDQAAMLKDLKETVEEQRALKERNSTVAAVAENYASRCVTEALYQTSVSAAQVERDDAEDRCKELSAEVQLRKESEAKIEGQLSEARCRARKSEEQLASANVRICSLTGTVERQRAELAHCARNEARIEAVVTARDNSLINLENQLKDIICSKKLELEKLDSQLRSLQAENATLKASLLRQLEEAKQRDGQSEELIRSLRSQIDKINGEADSGAHQVKKLAEKLGDAQRELAEAQRELNEANTGREAQLTERQNEVGRLESQTRELRGLRVEDRDNLYYYRHMLDRLHQDCRRWDWFCQQQSRKIEDLKQQNQVLRAGTTESASHTPDSSKDNLERERRHSYEKGDGTSHLCTIDEAEEKSSPTHDRRARKISPTESNASPVCVENAPPSADTSEMPQPRAGASERKNRARSKSSSSEAACTSAVCRQVTNQSEQVDSSVFWRHPPNESTLSIASNELDCEEERFVHAEQRRFGLPMSQENFERIMREENETLSASKSFNRSYDDGYGSAAPSRFHNRSRNVSVASSASVDSSPEDGESQQHYHVSYDGVTFDLASFSLARMRNLTSAIESTHTPEGMCRFLEFLADKAEELESHPQWRGRHNLGKPSDWAELKQHYT